ncbi:hypothetical protein CDL12_09795 [Handroanthus impetiginosus]|uniref:Uncharacterized protein n=1 Tax=Handroanthus impetiginosus TaxID=429701 RepID=A0A2G9HJ60_9LAMI|nr:hypothetical protein CDL12_09797 [Handroanthus impetiginosus]PIN17545.1 hypothetical protein CDL12_09795 [Handroanthus impetiginosus]
MEVHNYPGQQMQTTKVYSFDEFEEEDYVFYSELRRQVWQLTDEDEDVYKNKNLNMVQAPKQVPLCSVLQSRCNYDWPGNKEDCAAAPAWILNLWRSGNGTGVFIPQMPSRRKNRSRRKKNERGRIYKPVEKMN